MEIRAILTNVKRRDNVLNAFVRVCGGKVKSTWDGTTIPAIVGLNGPEAKIQKMCIEKSLPYIYIDHAYSTSHPELKQFRVCVSNYHCNDWRDSDRKLPVKIRPWKQTGNRIIILKPTASVGKVFPIDEWVRETTETLKKHTERPIFVKEKGEGGLNDCLNDAWAAVCHGSKADVDAALLGIPVFSGPRSPVWPISCHDLSQIENPIFPDREAWLRSLAGSEWHIDEIAQAWERIKPLVT